MFKLFRTARERPPAAAVPPGAPPDSRPPFQNSTLSPSSQPPQTAAARELAKVALRETLRAHGIPVDWVGCELIPRSLPGQPPAYQIQLIIRHWHEGLLRYAPLLQDLVLQGLQRFDPVTDHGVHSVVWRFSASCGYPHSRLPPASFWTEPTERPRFDLPPSSRDFRHEGDDFAPTAPSPLR